MTDKEIYREIKQTIASGEIASLPKKKLIQFQSALAQSHARLHLGAPQLPQICSTVDMHLAAALAKEPNPAPKLSTNKPNLIHNIGVGVFVVVMGAAAIWAISHYFGVRLVP
ncbi:MAG: hypothetical protein K9K30_14100 [Burkholderiaceae bacterium]|nr:hypothetical protein [Sulfuritalea sp.]MCF8176367.1 hypothetical protein [Burkholderiaceae bacterium]MCF8185031.1 hypothetical protein [Polynucleobacter sp.]